MCHERRRESAASRNRLAGAGFKPPSAAAFKRCSRVVSDWGKGVGRLRVSKRGDTHLSTLNLLQARACFGLVNKWVSPREASGAIGAPEAVVAKAAGAAVRGASEIGTITLRTTGNATRLGGEAGQPGIRIAYKDGTHLDMTATRVKQTEFNPFVGKPMPKKFENAINRQGTKRALTAEEIQWFSGLSF